jgi:hypothetical protein
MAIKEVVLLYTMKVDNPISLFIKKEGEKNNTTGPLQHMFVK